MSTVRTFRSRVARFGISRGRRGVSSMDCVGVGLGGLLFPIDGTAKREYQDGYII